jgi:hypothetical protein
VVVIVGAVSRRWQPADGGAQPAQEIAATRDKSQATMRDELTCKVSGFQERM